MGFLDRCKNWGMFGSLALTHLIAQVDEPMFCNESPTFESSRKRMACFDSAETAKTSELRKYLLSLPRCEVFEIRPLKRLAGIYLEASPRSLARFLVSLR